MLKNIGGGKNLIQFETQLCRTWLPFKEKHIESLADDLNNLGGSSNMAAIEFKRSRGYKPETK